MRLVLLAIGLVGLLLGSEFFVVDKVVLHRFARRAPARASEEPSEGRVVDLPDWLGFVVFASGSVCTFYALAMGSGRRAR